MRLFVALLLVVLIIKKNIPFDVKLQIPEATASRQRRLI